LDFPAHISFTITYVPPTEVRLVSLLKLVLWGSSHLAEYHGLPAVTHRGIQFAEVLNNSKGGEGSFGFPAHIPFTISDVLPTEVRLVGLLKLVLWGSSHLTEYPGLSAVAQKGIQFAEVLNNSKGGKTVSATAKTVSTLYAEHRNVLSNVVKSRKKF